MPFDTDTISQFIENVKKGERDIVEATLSSLPSTEAQELANTRFSEDESDERFAFGVHITPLLVAMLNNNSELVTLLLKHGADPNAVAEPVAYRMPVMSALGTICSSRMHQYIRGKSFSFENRPVNHVIIAHLLPRIKNFHEKTASGMGDHDMFPVFLHALSEDGFLEIKNRYDITEQKSYQLSMKILCYGI